jgi:hypothetical protein
MKNDNEQAAVLLSKWWKTKSARAAWRRAKERKRASLQKFLKARAEKQAELRRAVEEWDVKS